MDLTVELLMVLYTDPLARVTTWYQYLSWDIYKEHELCGWASSTFSIHSADFLRNFRYQSNQWNTINENYEPFVYDYIGLGIGVHHAIVCPIQIFSVVDALPYHSKIVAI